MQIRFATRAAAVMTALLLLGTFLLGASAQKPPRPAPYPWSPVPGGTTGDYLADNYDGLASGHVFENVTQERLLDLFCARGDYYILFAGPSRASAQFAVPVIGRAAEADGIEKIYVFDPLADGYQIDITDPNTPFKTTRSVHELWTRILEYLPNGSPFDDYDSENALLFLYNRDREVPVRAHALFTGGESETAVESAARTVFRGGNASGPVIAASVRSDFDFFKRIYNGFGTYFNANGGKGPDAQGNRTGQAVTEIFTEAGRDGFPLHQVTFAELLNILQSPGPKVILFGASWCHNTNAIIGEAARAAKEFGHKRVYVYDTTLGNQLTFGTGAEIDTVTAGSSTFNTRNSYNSGNGNHNVSYLYGEAVKYLGDFLTENSSKRNNRIHYLPDGDLNGSPTTDEPWSDGTRKGAHRLQLPFLIGYDRDAENPVTHSWLHKNSADDGTYTEYMLEYNWIHTLGNTPSGEIDGMSKTDFAAEAVAALRELFRSVPAPEENPGPDDPGSSEPPAAGESSEPAGPSDAPPPSSDPGSSGGRGDAEPPRSDPNPDTGGFAPGLLAAPLGFAAATVLVLRNRRKS